jgi:hypothetical protein
MGNRIDRLSIEGGGSALDCSEHERDRIALRPLPILGLSNSRQQHVAR